MGDFEQVLLRLKERLGLASDKDVAEALGMGEKALNARKRRGSFPVDKLKALAADRPELHLDVKYILTGVSDELERRLGALKKATAASSNVADLKARAFVQTAVFEAEVNAINADEQQLVHCFRRADAKGKALLLAMAVALDDTGASAPRKRGKK